jgi:hypothetical protein
MKIRGISLALVLSVCLTATAQDKKPRQVPSSPKKQKQALLIAIDMPETTVRVGSPIRGKMLMTNNSHNPLNVGWGSWESGGLEVRDSQGNEALTGLERCLRKGGQCNTTSNPLGPCPVEGEQCQTIMGLPLGGGPSFRLDPGKSYSESVEVNRGVYDLTRPGKYTIQWQGHYPSSKTVMKSNAITLTVVP